MRPLRRLPDLPLDPPAPRISDEQIEARADELAADLLRDGYITVQDGRFHVAQYTLEDDLLPEFDTGVTQVEWEMLSNELLLGLARGKAAPTIRKMRAMVMQSVRDLATKAAEKDLGI